MVTTKRRFKKTDGRQFYHFVQSFSDEDDLTPEEVNAIGIEFAQKQFPDFEVLVATHIDTDHLHNHLVVNSFSFESIKDTAGCRALYRNYIVGGETHGKETRQRRK